VIIRIRIPSLDLFTLNICYLLSSRLKVRLFGRCDRTQVAFFSIKVVFIQGNDLNLLYIKAVYI